MKLNKGLIIVSLLMVIIMLSGCGEKVVNDVGSSGISNSDASLNTKDEDAGEENENALEAMNELDAKRKAETPQLPDQFPLPLLDSWIEGEPFSELTTGKKRGWSAEYFYEGEIEDNAAQYEQLLIDHGYEVSANAMVSSALGKGYIVKGHISGIRYSGSVAFDTNAEGQNRAWMTFTEDKQD